MYKIFCCVFISNLKCNTDINNGKSSELGLYKFKDFFLLIRLNKRLTGD